MKIVTRSAWGALLQNCLLRGSLPPKIPFTTLNEKFNVLATADLNPGQFPALNYFAIGIGGHEFKVGADGVPYTSPKQHRPTDAALFKHIPFVVRPVDNDLTVVERANYALRTQEVYDGVNYFVYWLKRLDTSNSDPTVDYTSVSGGLETTVPYVTSLANLNPTPISQPNTGVITTDGDYVSTSSIVTINFSETDVAELINAAMIIYGNEAMSAISEIALVSGVDRKATVPGQGNTTFDMMEVAFAQINSFITTYHAVSFTNKGFSQDIEIGATEPMISSLSTVMANVG